LINNVYHWLIPSWTQLQARRALLPHALLLRGRAGLGKTLLARTFAQALLCDRPADGGFPCGTCAACNWFAQGNHPDFRQIEPEILAGTPEESGPKSSEPLSKQIKIDQVRALQSFLAVGTHRGGLRITIVRPAEAMNAATANALLKSLEEPIPGTLFLLVSSEPQRLLPTVRSRCQSIEIHAPDASVARAWLQEQGVREPDAALAYAGNSPCKVIEEGAEAAWRQRLVAEFCRDDLDPVAAADRSQGIEMPPFIDAMQKWLYDLTRVKAGSAPRYYPGEEGALARHSQRCAQRNLLRMWRELAQARAEAQHTLNARLFMENLYIKLAGLSEDRNG
jgi:DNA polymerase-3 subunit delta'